MSVGTWLPGSDIAFLPTLQVFCHEMATGRLGEMTQSAELLSCRCKEHLNSEHMPAMIMFRIPALGRQRPEDSHNFLTGQSSLIGELQTNKRYCLKEDGQNSSG